MCILNIHGWCTVVASRTHATRRCHFPTQHNHGLSLRTSPQSNRAFIVHFALLGSPQTRAAVGGWTELWDHCSEGSQQLSLHIIWSFFYRERWLAMCFIRRSTSPNLSKFCHGMHVYFKGQLSKYPPSHTPSHGPQHSHQSATSENRKAPIAEERREAKQLISNT